MKERLLLIVALVLSISSCSGSRRMNTRPNYPQECFSYTSEARSHTVYNSRGWVSCEIFEKVKRDTQQIEFQRLNLKLLQDQLERKNL